MAGACTAPISAASTRALSNSSAVASIPKCAFVPDLPGQSAQRALALQSRQERHPFPLLLAPAASLRCWWFVDDGLREPTIVARSTGNPKDMASTGRIPKCSFAGVYSSASVGDAVRREAHWPVAKLSMNIWTFSSHIERGYGSL
jgi:hypothetical protein